MDTMAKAQPSPHRKTLREALVKQVGRRTVLGVAIPILEAMLAMPQDGATFPGITASEIKSGFASLAGKYLRSEFSTTYLARPLSPSGFLEFRQGLYRFRPTLIQGMAYNDIASLRDLLLQSLQDEVERRRADIARLNCACEMPLTNLDERQALVEEYLKNFGGNLGENFEIISYAVLREYFATFGFRLQRFSTTHTNDGGMDYVGGDCIYQVSTDGGLGKLEGDLAKAPDIKRVIVRPHLDDAARQRADDGDFARIEMADLLGHFVGWLLARDTKSKRARHLQGILQVALAEFRREERAEQVVTA